MAECNCEILESEVLRELPRRIKHCPKHAAAGDMLAALENIEARLMSADCDPDDTREQNWHCGLLGYVVDTIAAARGGEPIRDRAKETLNQIAAMLREGELLEGTHEERCERSPMAAFSELDSVIVMAREAAGEPAARGGEA